MSTAFLTAIAVILCILFRILNVNSQPLKPSIWCIDETFLDCIYKIAPIFKEPYLAVGGSFKNLHYQFRLGASTIEEIIPETCKAIWDCLYPIVMRPPDTEDWILIAEKFKNMWNFPNCIGALDGKHIRIQCPPNAGSEYYNYKQFHSIVLQALVDAEGKFIFIDVGDYGRSSDSGVFNNSAFGQAFKTGKLNIPAQRKINNNNDYEYPFVVVADEAYPLLKNLMRPYSRKSLTSEKRIFNYRLSRARRLVECAFGMITKKFRVLENEILLHPDKVTTIVMAICVLHNFIKSKEKSYFADMNNHFEKTEAEGSEIFNTNRSSNTALQVRTHFTNYFNSNEGSVPWQSKYV